MLCNICKQKEATVHVTEIINNKMTELHLCENCAKEKSFQMEQHFGLADLLAGLSDVENQVQEKEKKKTKCSNCGLTYEDFRKIGRLGCSQCYSGFRENLKPLLKRIHRSTKHMGSIPLKKKELNKEHLTKGKSSVEETGGQMVELKRKMEEAVQREDFEEAAKIRDKIKELKKKNK